MPTLKRIYSVFVYSEGAQIIQGNLLYVNYFNKIYDVLSHEKLDFETLFIKANYRFNTILILKKKSNTILYRLWKENSQLHIEKQKAQDN